MGPAHLIRPTLAVSTRIVFCCNSVAQRAVAEGFERAEEQQFFQIQQKEYLERREVMMAGLDALGLNYTIPEGAYFILVNTEKLELPASFIRPEILKGRARDWLVSWFIAQEAGV